MSSYVMILSCESTNMSLFKPYGPLIFDVNSNVKSFIGIEFYFSRIILFESYL